GLNVALSRDRSSLSNGCPLFRKRAAADSEVNRVHHKQTDQIRPTQSMRASPGMENRQLWIRHRFSDFGQPAEEIPVFAGDKFFPITPNFPERSEEHTSELQSPD